jgi:hypothetical protein
MARGIFTLKQQLQGLQQKAWTSTMSTPAVDYLVVAGGGGGGGQAGSGGGAGGLLQGTVPVIVGSSITVTVGTGGGGGSNAGGTGVNSVFGSISASGGGGGNAYGTGPTAVSGGSGAGGNLTSGDAAGVGGQGVAGQGNRGGTSGTRNGQAVGAGGGGAGTVGLDTVPASGIPGNGGAGISSAISGTLTAYAGGGGGSGTGTAAGGTGGVGGGGAGAACGSGGVAGTAGTANTGGGGGAGSFGAGAGGNGGSGIVIVSYPDIYAGAAGTTGSPTVSTSGSGSLYLNGSSYWTVPSNTALNMSSSNFTMEGWYYPTGNATAGVGILSKRTNNSTVGGVLLYYGSTGLTPSLLVDIGGTWAINISSSIAFNSSQWNHFAIVRNGSAFNLYINGVSGISTTNAGAIRDNSDAFAIGADGAAAQNIINASYISNVRVVKGTAIYTGAFTPSTAPLTAVTNTSLLFNTVSGSQFADSSTNSFKATAGGSPAWNQLSPFATGLGYKNRVYTFNSSGTITF